MPRKSTVQRVSSAQRRLIDRRFRENQLTLDEIFAEVRAKFPDEDSPSRSSLGRYGKKFAELSGRMRDIRAAGTAMVAELGEDPNDRGGQLLVEAVTSLATHAAMQATDPEAADLSAKEVGELARAARAVLQARKMSLAERQEIAKAAREAALRESRAKVEALGKSGAVDAGMLKLVIQAAYGDL